MVIGSVSVSRGELTALLVLAGFVWLLAQELSARFRIRRRLSLPVLIVAVGAVVAYVGIVRDSGEYWALRQGPRGPLVAVSVLAVTGGVGVLAATGRARISALASAAAWFVMAATWVPVDTWPTLQPGPRHAVVSCLKTLDGYGTFGTLGVRIDVIPNVALYVPLGVVLALLMSSRRWAAALIVVATTVGTELYQAAFTTRVCSPNDMMANALGGLLGVAGVVLVERWADRAGLTDRWPGLRCEHTEYTRGWHTRRSTPGPVPREPPMSIKLNLLALLAEKPTYGLRVLSEFEARTGGAWPLNVGQVYTTLGRLERDGLVEALDADTEGRILYRLTTRGFAEVDNGGSPRSAATVRLATNSSSSWRWR